MAAKKTPKFSIGDKVVVLDGSNLEDYAFTWVNGMCQYIGKVYSIRDISYNWHGMVAYTLDGCDSFKFDERRLEKVSDQKTDAESTKIPKFKIGDIVLVLDGSDLEDYFGGWTPSMTHMIGRKFRIKDITFGFFDSKEIGYFLSELDESKPFVTYIFDERGLSPVEAITSAFIRYYYDDLDGSESYIQRSCKFDLDNEKVFDVTSIEDFQDALNSDCYGQDQITACMRRSKDGPINSFMKITRFFDCYGNRIEKKTFVEVKRKELFVPAINRRYRLLERNNEYLVGMDIKDER